MSLTEHITAQRTEHGVPLTLACRALGVAPSTFYEQRAGRRRPPGGAAVKECFATSERHPTAELAEAALTWPPPPEEALSKA